MARTVVGGPDPVNGYYYGDVIVSTLSPAKRIVALYLGSAGSLPAIEPDDIVAVLMLSGAEYLLEPGVEDGKVVRTTLEFLDPFVVTTT